MSSLIFWTDETQALVATDTLAVSPDGKPVRFTTKAFIVPHLRLIMAGTGAGGFLGRWFVQVNDNMLVRGIEHLDYHTPRILAAYWLRFKQEFSITDTNRTTTVYHFGFSENTGLIRTFAYRSANEFRSERVGYGLGYKPECRLPEGYQIPRDIRRIMDDQREVQAASPTEGTRLYIGGEIMLHHISKSGFVAYPLDRFEDYATDEEAMYENFRAEEEKKPSNTE
ncbi:MAG: hypothetical protein WB562_02935 [Candidatus Sulfotelmatobacter sp.]